MIKNKKPWYIWFSVIAFMFLVSNTTVRISCYERENKIKFGESPWFGFSGRIFASWLIFIMLPAGVTMLLMIVAYTYAGTFWVRVANLIGLICIYFAGAYATYRHVKWRNKNIPHLLKAAKDRPSIWQVILWKGILNKPIPNRNDTENNK